MEKSKSKAVVGQAKKVSFHIQLEPDEVRRVRILAAERGMTAGRLARQLLMQTVDLEAKATKR